MDVNCGKWREEVRKRLIFLGHLPGSAEQFRILTAQQLLGRGRSVSCLEEQASTDSSSGFVVLVGKLVSAVDEVSCKDYHLLQSDLMFSDSSGQIPCFVLNISPSVVDRVAIIYQWTFIKHTSGLQYLEVGKMELMSGRGKWKPESKLSAFIPRDALFLQANRHVIGIDLVNLIGQVSAISHPIRYKSSVIFLIQFQDSETKQRVVVLNRSMKKIHWQMLIRPRQEYVLTNLRPTTLSIGEDKTDVLLITDDSECRLVSEIPGRTETIKIQVYLKERGFNEEMFLTWKNSKGNEDSKSHPRSFNIVKFEGTVTSAELSHLGVFELNGTVRVHLNRISAIRSFQHLRPNTKITLFNVHISKSTQGSYRVIHCCSYGCVRIASFSKDLTRPLNPDSLINADEQLESLVPIVAPILSDCRLPFVDFDLALDSAKTLQRQFCPGIIVKLDSQLLHNAICGNCSQIHRNPIVEFITDDHGATCGISAKSVKKDAFRLVTVSDLCRVFQDFDAEIKDKLVTAEEPGWNCQFITSKDLSPHLVVVAALRCNPLTAKLQLRDQTGSIDCVIVNALDSSKGVSDLHQCMDGNCCTPEEARFPFRPICPFPQTWHVGDLFRLSEFRVVRERFFQTSGISSQSAGNSLVCTYVEFSLVDALCLSKLDSLHPSYRWLGHNDRETGSQGKRQKLTSTAGNAEGSRRTGANPRENFTQDNRRVQENAPIQLRPDGDACRCFVAQKFLLFHKQSIRSQGTLSGLASLSFCLDALLFGDVDKFSCGCRLAATVGRRTTVDAAVTGQHVYLLFRNRCAFWYPLLHVGCAYRLTVYGRDELKILDGDMVSPELQKFGAKPEIALKSNVRIDRIFRVSNDDDALNGPSLSARLCFSDVEHVLIRPLIDDLKKKSNEMLQEMLEDGAGKWEKKLFSFKGIIVTRGFKELQTSKFEPRNTKQNGDALLQLGVAFAGGVDIWLAVRELASPEEHHVFINLSQMQYPLGLFVGSVVHLEKLERYVSSKQRPYFKFLSISSCTLLSFPRITWKDLSWSLDGVVRSEPQMIAKFLRSDHPRVFIQDLEQDLPASSSSSSILISCQIYKIYFLLLEFSCASHGVVRTDDSGRCVKCEGPTEFRASARFNVGDGSGTAVVLCHDNQVAKLLNFKADEWEELKSFVGEFGGFRSFHEGGAMRARSDPYPTAAAVLVNAICESNTVLRPVLLEAKPLKETHGNGAIRRRRYETARTNGFDQRRIALGDSTFLDTWRLPDIRLQYISLCDFTAPNSVMF